MSFPGWLSGPLHGVFGRLNQDPLGMSIGLSAVILAMGVAYGVALAVGAHALDADDRDLHRGAPSDPLLGPPLPLTDLFNYLGYARLGALHHLNPYTHVIAQASHDPVFRFTSWHNLRSPYGPAFTAASYPLAFLRYRSRTGS